MAQPIVASRWDEEYERGRYEGEPPIAFVEDIIRAVREHGVTAKRGLYIGCGNGRNYIALVRVVPDLVGIDVSRTAIDQLAARLPQRAPRLVCGDLSALPAGSGFGLVVGIQVFQHGDAESIHEHIRAAIALVEPGGLFALRVNAVGTVMEYSNTLLEGSTDGGFTIRYDAGPKRGLAIHFFCREEVRCLTGSLIPVMPLRVQRTVRPAPNPGHWDQWEGIWRRAA